VTAFGAGRVDFTARRFFGDTAAVRTELHATLKLGDTAQPLPAAQHADEADAVREAATGPAPVETTTSARASAGSAGLALPAPDTWYTASEVDVRAEPLSEVRLRYPENLSSPVAGTVRIRLFIDEGGVVRKLQIASSEPPGLFDEAAKRAWEDVRFTPARKNGVAVKSQKLVELTYAPTGSF